MDGITEHRKALRRIAAVLLALADVAECASARSIVVRSLVLWLLRPGETLARDYLASLAGHAPGQNEPPPLLSTNDSAAEAMRLAASFRGLATVVAALAVETFPPQHQAIAARCRRQAATGPLAALRGWAVAVERLDSS